MKKEKSFKEIITGYKVITAVLVITMCLSLMFTSTTEAYQIQLIESIDSKSVSDDINRLRLRKTVFRGESVIHLPL